MVDSLQFTRNYNDLGTERGFQFEFFCDRCGNGFRTPFKSFGLGAVDGVVDVANSLLGGILGRAADVSDRISSASRERAHDQAFMEAANQLRPEFMQCPRCSSWVCRKSCWNHKKGLCKGCAPDLGVTMYSHHTVNVYSKSPVTSPRVIPLPEIGYPTGLSQYKN